MKKNYREKCLACIHPSSDNTNTAQAPTINHSLKQFIKFTAVYTTQCKLKYTNITTEKVVDEGFTSTLNQYLYKLNLVIEKGSLFETQMRNVVCFPPQYPRR